MKKFICIALAALMCCALFAGCTKTGTTGAGTDDASASAAADTGDDWNYIKSNGKLVIGITEYQPMNYYDENGTLVGFDTEFAQAACDRLGIKAEFVVIDWSMKETELESKNIDCIWNGFTVTPEREQTLSFSEPYMVNKQVIVIRADDAGKYTDTASLSSANLVAEESSAGESAISADANLSKGMYTPVASLSTALMEVKAGTADAAVVDSVMAEAMVGEGTDYSDLKIVDNVVLAEENYAIGFRSGSSAVDQFNSAIDALRADGTLQSLADKYDLSMSLITK